ncbi:MAG: MFS transporter, partial [Verrucomicrobiota bacterium]
KAVGLESKWNDVLEKQMRYQSLTFVFAMTIGAVVYDASLLNKGLALIGLDWTLTAEQTMKFPLFLTLLLSFGALAVALKITDIASPAQAKAKQRTFSDLVAAPIKNTLSAGAWILKTPAAFAIILCGLLFDHAVRQVLTINSEFYRQISIPEWSFGLIGAILGTSAVFFPKIGNYLVTHSSPGRNFLLLGVLAFLGLWLMSLFIPYWGAVPMILLYAAIALTGYFVSNYLNRIASSDIRATVLSFKGLSFNLAYGGIAYGFGLYVAHIRNADTSSSLDEGSIFQTAFAALPWYFAAAFAIILIYTLILRSKISHALSQQTTDEEPTANS